MVHVTVASATPCKLLFLLALRGYSDVNVNVNVLPSENETFHHWITLSSNIAIMCSQKCVLLSNSSFMSF